jgi:predicted tellurium resistance membrane protein TerC
MQAVKIIIVADLTMSLDNVLGVAGAASRCFPLPHLEFSMPKRTKSSAFP